MAVQLSSSYLRCSFQILAKLNPGSISNDEAFEQACSIVYRWGKRKFSRIFRQMPDFQETLDYKRDGNEIGVIYEPQNSRFIFRGVHPDTSIPGRLWTTDVQISKSNDVYHFAVRLSVTSLQYCTVDVPYSCPGFIREVMKNVGLSDIISIKDEPHIISTGDEVREFISFLENRDRQMPVLLISPCFYEDDALHNGYMTDSYQVAKNLCGVAHVFFTTPDANDYLRETLGSQWTPYNGAIRTYYPKLSFAESDPYQHPLITPQNIRTRMASGDGQGESWILDIERYIKGYTVKHRVPWQENGILFYLTAHQDNLKEQRLASAQSHEELIALYEEEIDQIQRQSDEYSAMADAYAQDWETAAEENEELRQLVNRLKSQITTLRSALENASGSQSEQPVPVNGTYAEMSDWVERYYSDRLSLHSRAKRSLKNACYEDIELVYKCLALLATSYYNYRMGFITYNEFTTACSEVDSGLEERGAITDVAAGMEGDTYYVQYQGQRRKLERHLTKGNNKDKRYCLRIYFFWDDQDNLVVIGDLPHHLDTSAT